MDIKRYIEYSRLLGWLAAELDLFDIGMQKKGYSLHHYRKWNKIRKSMEKEIFPSQYWRD